MSKKLYFIHKKGDEFLKPASGWLQQLGVRKSKGLGHNKLSMHYNEGIEICYVLKGIYRWQVEDRHYQVYPGQLFITCPWQWHGSPDEVLDRGILGWLVIQPQKFLENGELELGDWSSLSVESQKWLGSLLALNDDPVLPQDKDIAPLLRDIHKELTEKDDCYLEKANMRLDSLLIHIGRMLKSRQSSSSDADEFVKAIHKLLADNIHQKINMEELACSLGMSPSAFNKKVKRLTGFSPAEYLIGLRIKKATKLLSETDMKIIDITYECGFSSSQYFATQFMNLMGSSPSVYRRKLKS